MCVSFRIPTEVRYQSSKGPQVVRKGSSMEGEDEVGKGKRKGQLTLKAF